MSTEGYVIENGTFVKYEGPEVEILEIPDGVTDIKGNSLKESRASLGKCKKIVFPASVKSVWNCLLGEDYDGWFAHLEELVFLGDIDYIAREAFCKGDESWSGIKGYGIDIKRIRFEGNVGTINNHAFCNCRKLESLTFEGEVEHIDGWAFDGCSNLKTLVFPKDVGTFDWYAFSDCRNLESITFRGNVGEITADAFTDCSSLESITFGGSVGNVAMSAFYKAKIRNLTFPEDVGVIYDGFCGCRSLESVTFGGNVGGIGKTAFYETALKKISVPGGIETLGERAFSYCKNLEEVVIPEVKSLGEDCFNGCKNLKKLDIPKDCKASYGTFSGCSLLGNEEGQVVYDGILYDTREEEEDKRIWTSLPEGITTIDRYAIRSEDSFMIPAGIINIGEQRVNKLNHIEYAEDYFKTNQELSGEGFVQLLDEKWIKKISAEDWAYLYLFQTRKEIREILRNNKKDVNDVVTGMVIAIDKFGKAKQCVVAAEYIIENMNDVSQENVQKMHDLSLKRKSKKAAGLLEPCIVKEVPIEENDPYALWKQTYKEHILDLCIREHRGDEKQFKKVRMADSEELAPAFLVKCAVVPYLEFYTGTPKHISGYKSAYMDVAIIELADKAAMLLNRSDLQELLEKEYRIGTSAWLIPYGRYASKTQITDLISKMKAWSQWYRYGRSGRTDIIIARSGLMLSDTREAIMYFDKNYGFHNYAKIRGTTVDVIRDTVLMDFGLDVSGKKEYDLGSKKIVVSLTKELKFEIYDTVADKIIKSIPKRGTDPELVAKASSDFSEMKKNLKKVVKARNDLLFQRFLSGSSTEAESWIASYTKNPILHRIAELIVWSQGTSTFILTEDDVIDCYGKSYQIDTKTAIEIAHPMDMKKEEVEAWQKYFTSNGLKQAFLQIWEPVVDTASVNKERYKGCMIPFYRLRSQEKHGIHCDYSFQDEEGSYYENAEITFDDCDVEIERVDWNKRDLSNADEFEITSFIPNANSRRANHIMIYLDKITIYGRVLNDDTSVASLLEGFTLAQIMEFINVAIENHSNNCVALLLEFKQENFADYDPMEEFTLD